ncbi:MAG: trypsin-like peptidase domain-containing protein [Patescibacteria group bacterium]|nr:trypsin-like peptidase domain-containing protein [Patescibacteria group bacterium]
MLNEDNNKELKPDISIPAQDVKQNFDQNKNVISNISARVIAILAAVSLVAGLVGGALGIKLMADSASVRKLLGNNPVVANSSGQNITLTEDSAIIDVVKKASPAVVSVVISKDLSKIPGYGINPFNFDPFNFFGGGSPSNNSSNTPNVQQVGAGSGFFVSSDGLILTNKHVVEDTQASYTVITSDGTKYDAVVEARDPVNDLAVLKIKISNAPYLSLADSSKIQIGQRVVAIGNSLGEYQNTVTSGIVSGIGRSITAGSSDSSEQLSGVIQTDVAINPGNSGGPLLDAAGQVIGINTAIDQQGQLVGFALPSNDAARALASYQKSGKITQPFIGVRYVMITKDIASQEKLPTDYGALILRGQNMTDFAVVPGSPADKAGLAENDIILEVNGTKVDGSNTLSSLVQKHNIGDTVSLKVYHKGQEKTVNLTLGEAN